MTRVTLQWHFVFMVPETPKLNVSFSLFARRHWKILTELCT